MFLYGIVFSKLIVVLNILMAESESSQEIKTDESVTSVDRSSPENHIAEVEPESGR